MGWPNSKQIYHPIVGGRDYAGFLMLRQCAILSNEFAENKSLVLFLSLFFRDNAMNRKVYFGLLKTAWKWMKLAEAEKNPLNGQDQTDNSCTMIRHKCIWVIETSQKKKQCSTSEWATKGVKNETNTLTFTDYPLMNSFVLLSRRKKVDVASARKRKIERKSKQTESNHKNCIAATVSYLPWTQWSRWWTNVTSHISQECNEAKQCTNTLASDFSHDAWHSLVTTENECVLNNRNIDCLSHHTFPLLWMHACNVHFIQQQGNRLQWQENHVQA